MIQQMLSNWVCWVIVLLAFLCYQQLWEEYFTTFDVDGNEGIKYEFSGILIGALPLLGLLGTIIGLLDCFAGMARGGASNALLSGGIADALITTQLGLICAVPGWLLQGYIRSQTPQPHVSMISR